MHLEMVLREHVHLGLDPLQQLVLHHHLGHLLLTLSHLVAVLLLTERGLYLAVLEFTPREVQ